MRSIVRSLVAWSVLAPVALLASSHMDAPLITLDPAANTTDVYSFVTTPGGVKNLTVGLAVYPFEEPGIGPNKYNFDDNVLYEIHVATGADVAAGKATYSYQFQFTTSYKNRNTILQSYLGVIQHVGDANQNLTQTYTVSRRTAAGVESLGNGMVPPNNQGVATPFYNQDSDGEKPALDGAATASDLDRYTQESIFTLKRGYRVFCGQRDDAFSADIQAIFDLLQLRNPGVDAQKGFNVHTIVLNIPVSDIGGDQQVVGVYATTSRRQVRVLQGSTSFPPSLNYGAWVQVGRQGNPLFCEGLVAIADKDLYNRTPPSMDKALFEKYALNPELAALINAIVFGGSGPAVTTGRTDIAGIFIPDLIKTDLSTGRARLPGSQTNPGNPDDAGYHRLGIFGGDTLTSTVQAGFGGGTVPGGWPNGRRFGDDVTDIAVTALISDLRGPIVIRGPAGDNVDHNDMGFNKVFPYSPTPQNGRIHTHHHSSP